MYDVIVVGTGGIGSAALYCLARSGVRVMGLDRFPAGHDQGSSHGESRMIRKSYFEHPDYVPLARQSWTLWQQLEQETGKTLLQPTGVAYYGRHDGVVMSGVRKSARQHGLPLEEMSAEQAATRFPQFKAPQHTDVLYEADAGVLLVEDCVRSHISEAVRHGAGFRHGVAVTGISPTKKDVTVVTEHGSYTAAAVIVTVGAWTPKILSSLNLPLRVVRKHLHWYTTSDSRLQMDKGCPAFFVEHQQGYFYGLPQIGPSGVKVGEHSGGSIVDDPLKDPRRPEKMDRERVDRFTNNFLPQAGGVHLQQKCCYYTMTPDEHFIVDRHPRYPNVVFTAGLSGHGFKFAPVLGQRMAELAISSTNADEPAAPTDFLSLKRLQSK